MAVELTRTIMGHADAQALLPRVRFAGMGCDPFDRPSGHGGRVVGNEMVARLTIIRQKRLE